MSLCLTRHHLEIGLWERERKSHNVYLLYDLKGVVYLWLLHAQATLFVFVVVMVHVQTQDIQMVTKTKIANIQMSQKHGKYNQHQVNKSTGNKSPLREIVFQPFVSDVIRRGGKYWRKQISPIPPKIHAHKLSTMI